MKNVELLIGAVRASDSAHVRALLDAHPGLVNTDLAENDEHRALHYAVLDRAPEMVRLLMERGADARKGIYPHRDATSPLTLAAERGYDEIVAIIEHEQQRRRVTMSTTTTDTGVGMTARSAVALGEGDWLRARHAEGKLDNPIENWGGLLTAAVHHDRPEILALLLDFGFDPDERTRLNDVESEVYSWGMPLWHCARSGKYEMAEMLLARGADANGQVYASGSVMYAACVGQNWGVVKLLEDHGGLVDAATAGHLRLTDRAKQMLDDQDAGRLPKGMFTNESLVWELLWAGLRGGDPEIVRMTLERVDWPRDDPRWFGMLWSPLPCHDARSEEDHSLFLACFRQVLDRCDANIRHPRFGRTLLHDVAASGEQVTAEQALAFTTMLLDAGARTNERDDLLKSTPLGWACRWGRIEIVTLLLKRGADPVEDDAEPWASPRVWAQRMGHEAVLAALREYGR